jgi:hypothetical protein
MRLLLGSGLVLLSLAAAAPGVAMTRDSLGMAVGGRATIADPDEKLERLANAASAGDRSHGKPKRSARNVLRDDNYLRDAFGWLDNK